MGRCGSVATPTGQECRGGARTGRAIGTCDHSGVQIAARAAAQHVDNASCYAANQQHWSQGPAVARLHTPICGEHTVCGMLAAESSARTEGAATHVVRASFGLLLPAAAGHVDSAAVV
jgi:hypothetical protein